MTSEPDQAANHTVRSLLDEIVIPELYRKNPFRILGLPSTATTRAITMQVQKLQVLAELGSTDPNLAGAFPLNPPPTLEEIKAAERELHDPVRRVIHELFWLWPLDGGDGGADPGYLAAKARNLTEARKLWSTATEPGQRSVGRHNVTVSFHLSALGYERRGVVAGADVKAKQMLEQLWEAALPMLHKSLTDDGTWAALSARVLAMDDERVSLSLVQELRAEALDVVLGLNASLLSGYVAAGNPDAVRLHWVALCCKGMPEGTNWDRIFELVNARVTARFAAALNKYDPDIKGNEGAGLSYAKELLQVAEPFLTSTQLLDILTDYGEWRRQITQLVRRANQYAVAYLNATKDNQGFVEVLEQVHALGTDDPELEQTVQENIDFGKSQQVSALTDPFFERLKQIKEGVGSHREKMAAISTELLPKLQGIEAACKQHGVPSEAVFDSVAMVLRSLSVDAWNDKSDLDTATKAIELAEVYVRSREHADTIRKDKETLKGLWETTEKLARERKKKDSASVLGWAAVIIGFIVIVGWLSSIDSHSTATAPAPTPRAEPQSNDLPVPTTANASPGITTPAFSEHGNGQTYKVPPERNTELAADEQAMAAKKATLDQLDLEIAQEKLQLQGQEALIDNTNQYQVDAFNAKVKAYNRKIREGKRLTSEYNQMVNAYNTKLQTYGTRE